MAAQPDPAPYLGAYRRPPLDTVVNVATDNGKITLDGNTIGFYAPDRAIVTSGTPRGNPIEFIRNAQGTVGWVRVVGRIARKD